MTGHTFSTTRSGKTEVWDVVKLIKLTEGLEVVDWPLERFKGELAYPMMDKMTGAQLADEIRYILKVDLGCPVIVSAEGFLMDGYHRLIKSVVTGASTIKVVQFRETPTPDGIQ